MSPTSNTVVITGLEVRVAGTTWRNLVLVKVTTDAGITGWGEATLEYREHAVAAHLEFLRPIVRGLDALAPGAVWKQVVGRDFFRDDRVGLAAASGIMVACLDIAGKAYGVPVHMLLGGAVRDRVPVYANGWYQGERSPESFASMAQAVLDKGHTALKLDPYGAAGELATAREVDLGNEIVAAVREAVGAEVAIYVDVHGRFTPAIARQAVMELARHRVGYVEEPIGPSNLPALRDLRSASPLPIAAGERCIGRAGFRPLIEQDCVDVVQPDICWCGGLLEAQRIAAWAETHQMLVSLHNANSPLATMVGLHLGVTLPNLLTLETFDDFEEPWVSEAIPGVPPVEAGTVSIPQGPGIGIEPREDSLVEHPYKPVFMDIGEPGWELRRAEIE